MNAKEARELAEKSLKGPVIKPLLDALYEQIRHAAENGRKSISHPWSGLRIPYPTPDQQEAIWIHLISVDGYTVRHHPDPDPGDPRSSAYTEISWT